MSTKPTAAIFMNTQVMYNTIVKKGVKLDLNVLNSLFEEKFNILSKNAFTLSSNSLIGFLKSGLGFFISTVFVEYTDKKTGEEIKYTNKEAKANYLKFASETPAQHVIFCFPGDEELRIAQQMNDKYHDVTIVYSSEHGNKLPKLDDNIYLLDIMKDEVEIQGEKPRSIVVND